MVHTRVALMPKARHTCASS